jgi:pyruvate/2-oxoglutarate dehydrogenase complex dihydrolipoamide dehydrogenase (E3) component
LQHYDVLILGSGAGGKLLAWHFGQSGYRTAVVERRWIGGSCPNIACLPSKNEVRSAEIAHLVRNAAQYGTTTSATTIDMRVVRQRKRAMVDDLVALHLRNYQVSGAELIMGTGRFVAPKTLEVTFNDGGSLTLAGDRVIIDVGSRAAIPSVPGLEAAQPLTHIEALELDHLPAHLIVLGGGYVGLELAQAYRRFGSRVTIIEQGPQLMGREDPDVADEVQAFLRDDGIEVMLSAGVVGVSGRSGQTVTVTVRTNTGEQRIKGTDILVAAGRVPNTVDIGLETTGVALDARGYIRVDDRLQTDAAGVWAVGDCAGSPQFTHVAEDDFRVIRDNLAGGNRSTRDRLVPYCMFTDPPLAHVGLSETDAQRQGVSVRVARVPTSVVLRTFATGQRRGFMKALVATGDDRILGFTMVGADAGEVMTVVQTAMLADLPYQRLRDAVLTHPTMAEGLGPLLATVPAR